MRMETEMEAFRLALPELLASHRGRYALVGGSPAVVDGVFVSADQAIAAGYERFGPFAAFLVREITEPESPKYFSRKVRPLAESMARRRQPDTDHALNFSE